MPDSGSRPQPLGAARLMSLAEMWLLVQEMTVRDARPVAAPRGTPQVSAVPGGEPGQDTP